MILAIFGDFRVFDMTSLMTSLWVPFAKILLKTIIHFQ